MSRYPAFPNIHPQQQQAPPQQQQSGNLNFPPQPQPQQQGQLQQQQGQPQFFNPAVANQRQPTTPLTPPPQAIPAATATYNPNAVSPSAAYTAPQTAAPSAFSPQQQPPTTFMPTTQPMLFGASRPPPPMQQPQPQPQPQQQLPPPPTGHGTAVQSQPQPPPPSQVYDAEGGDMSQHTTQQPPQQPYPTGTPAYPPQPQQAYPTGAPVYPPQPQPQQPQPTYPPTASYPQYPQQPAYFKPVGQTTAGIDAGMANMSLGSHPQTQYMGAPQPAYQQPQHQIPPPMGGMAAGAAGPTASDAISEVGQQQISTSQESTLPRPILSNFFNEPPQPDVSPLFRPYLSEGEDNVDFSKAQASTRYLRATVQAIPNAPALQQKWNIPLGAIIHPFAEPPSGENIPVVHFGSSGVVRCRRCRTYINPFVVFIEKGTRWRCNMCQNINDVPQDYYCPVDARGKRTDLHRRPELTHGSCEFVAPSEYMVRPPQPPAYLFVIDVSYNAVQSGMLSTVADTILSVLDRLPGEGRTQIGFITVDSTIHFYNLKSSLTQPQMFVVGDFEDTILPLPSDLLVNLTESRSVIEVLLTKLRDSMFRSNTNVECAMGAALNAASKILGAIGGKLLMFSSGLPSLGPGRLDNRDDPKAYGTDKEKQLLQPRHEYKEIALAFSKDQICVELFSTAAMYTDIATMGCLPKFTGGNTYYYPAFRSDRDAAKLKHDLSRVLTRETGLEAVMRIRCSQGLTISNFFGHFFVRGQDLLALPNIDADKGFGIQISHTGNYLALANACVQAAVLYTNSSGSRRIRVHTLSLPVTAQLNDLFRSVDIDATMNLLAKMATDDAIRDGLPAARNKVKDVALNVLRQYRNNISAQSRASSLLVLPDSLRLLPLYSSGLIKSAGLSPGTDVRADARCATWQQIATANTFSTMRMIHPMLFDLTGGFNPDNAGDPSASAQDFQYPPLVPLSYSQLKSYGVYLLDDLHTMWVWFGSDVDATTVKEIMIVADQLNNIQRQEATEEEHIVTTPVAKCLAELARRLRRDAQAYSTGLAADVRVVQQRGVGEDKLRKLLIEDKDQYTMSYSEYLVHIHNQLKTR